MEKREIWTNGQTSNCKYCQGQRSTFSSPTISDYISVVKFARHCFQCGGNHYLFTSIVFVWSYAYTARCSRSYWVRVSLSLACKLQMCRCVSIFQQPTDSLLNSSEGEKTNRRRLPNSIAAAAAATTTTDGSDSKNGKSVQISIRWKMQPHQRQLLGTSRGRDTFCRLRIHSSGMMFTSTLEFSMYVTGQWGMLAATLVLLTVSVYFYGDVSNR